MSSPPRCDDPLPDEPCPRNQLEWYVNGSLSAEERASVERRLTRCQTCRADAHTWDELRQRLHEVNVHHTPAPRADLFALIERRLDSIPRQSPAERMPDIAYTVDDRSQARPPLRAIGELIWTQARILRPGLFWAPLLLAPVVGALVSLPSPWRRSTDTVALLSALVVALGMAFLYGHDVDPAREMTQATPTPSRVVLALRCGLVFGFDLLINCGLLLPFLTLNGAVTPAWFLAQWLAPLCFLSAISLLVSVTVNANTAVLVCVSLWGLRALSNAPTLLFGGLSPTALVDWQQLYSGFWRQEPLLFAGALLAVILTFGLLERKEQIAR